jgi:hypothetical protein
MSLPPRSEVGQDRAQQLGAPTVGESIPGSAALLEDDQAAPAPPAGVAPAAPPRTDAPVSRRQPPRDAVRTVECPQCSAAPSQPCQGRRGDRRSNHLARVELATELRGRKRLQPARTGAETRPVSTQSSPRRSERSGHQAGLDGGEMGATICTDLDG